MDSMDARLRERVEQAAAVKGIAPEEMVESIVSDYFRRLDELKELIAEADGDFVAGRVHTLDQVRERLEKYLTDSEKSSA
jgi:hypothetical protein